MSTALFTEDTWGIYCRDYTIYVEYVFWIAKDFAITTLLFPTFKCNRQLTYETVSQYEKKYIKVSPVEELWSFKTAQHETTYLG